MPESNSQNISPSQATIDLEKKLSEIKNSGSSEQRHTYAQRGIVLAKAMGFTTEAQLLAEGFTQEDIAINLASEKEAQLKAEQKKQRIKSLKEIHRQMEETAQQILVLDGEIAELENKIEEEDTIPLPPNKARGSGNSDTKNLHDQKAAAIEKKKILHRTQSTIKEQAQKEIASALSEEITKGELALSGFTEAELDEILNSKKIEQEVKKGETNVVLLVEPTQTKEDKQALEKEKQNKIQIIKDQIANILAKSKIRKIEIGELRAFLAKPSEEKILEPEEPEIEIIKKEQKKRTEEKDPEESELLSDFTLEARSDEEIDTEEELDANEPEKVLKFMHIAPELEAGLMKESTLTENKILELENKLESIGSTWNPVKLIKNGIKSLRWQLALNTLEKTYKKQKQEEQREAKDIQDGKEAVDFFAAELEEEKQKKTKEKERQQEETKDKIEEDKKGKAFMYFAAEKIMNPSLIPLLTDSQTGLIDLRNFDTNNKYFNGGFRFLKQTILEGEGFFDFNSLGFIKIIKNVNEVKNENGINSQSPNILYKIVGPDGTIVADDIQGYEHATRIYEDVSRQYLVQVEKEYNNLMNK